MTKWIVIALVAFVAFFHWNSGRTARAFEKATAELQRRAPMDLTRRCAWKRRNSRARSWPCP